MVLNGDQAAGAIPVFLISKKPNKVDSGWEALESGQAMYMYLKVRIPSRCRANLSPILINFKSTSTYFS